MLKLSRGPLPVYPTKNANIFIMAKLSANEMADVGGFEVNQLVAAL